MCCVPATLVDDELAQAVVASILVSLADDPSWGVTDAKVDNFSLMYQIVEAKHDLGNTCCEVPPMEV